MILRQLAAGRIIYHAFTSILSSYINPEAQEARAELLEDELHESSFLLTPLKHETSKKYEWFDFGIAPTDTHLIIPKLGKSVPILTVGREDLLGENWVELEDQIQDALQNGVVHYSGTAAPGQSGNFFITGHSSYYAWDPGQFKDVFALLDQLEVGDEYYVYYNQTKYTYRIFEKFIVDPNDTSVLDQPADKKISTLMTCYPVTTAESRLIIRAEQL